jgi:hypothetical protein
MASLLVLLVSFLTCDVWTGPVFIVSAFGPEGSSSANDSQQDRDDSDHQKNVNKLTSRGSEKPQDPQEQKNKSDNVKDVHGVLFE